MDNVACLEYGWMSTLVQYFTGFCFWMIDHVYFSFILYIIVDADKFDIELAHYIFYKWSINHYHIASIHKISILQCGCTQFDFVL